MIYKIILSNSKNEIQVSSDEELAKIIASIQRGDKVIICKQGIFNPSFVVGIFEDREAYTGVFQHLKTLEERQAKELELKNEPSSFAKALCGENFSMLEKKVNLLN